MLTEARVVLPGGQALLGFQLAIVLTRGFEQLPKFSQAVHAVSLGLVALAVVLLMAPAAYHRIVLGGEEDEAKHCTGSLMLTAATLPLVMGLAGDISYVVIAKIAASPAAALLLLVGLWHVLPLVMRTRVMKPARRHGRRR